MTKTVLDLFSGIGGFSLGLERTGGFRTAAFCEIEPYARRVLAKHWPEVPCYDDVRTLTAARLAADGVAGPDVVCGGFPCQDICRAGSRLGFDGARSSLWSEIVRLLDETRPAYGIFENSADLLNIHSGAAFARVLGDLAALGYDAEWHVIPAWAVGACHRRDRVYIVAHAHQVDGQARLGILADRQAEISAIGDAGRAGIWLETARPAPGMDDGVSGGLDRRLRTEVLGNSVLPQIPELIGRAILETEGARV